MGDAPALSFNCSFAANSILLDSKSSDSCSVATTVDGLPSFKHRYELGPKQLDPLLTPKYSFWEFLCPYQSENKINVDTYTYPV